MLWRFRVFVTWQQNTPDSEFLLEKYQSKLLGKGGISVFLSSKFTESSTTLLHRARLRRLHKCIENTHRKLVLTKVNFGSKFVLKTDLYFIRKSVPNSTELLFWVRGRSLNQQLARCSKIFVVTLSQIISSFSLAVDFWEVQSIESQNLQITDWVLNEYFQNSFSSAQNIFIINLDAIVALSYRPVAIAMWNYKLRLKFRAKIKE